MSKRRNWFKISALGVLFFLLLSGLIGVWQAVTGGGMGFSPYIAKVKVTGPIMDADSVLDQLKTVEKDDSAKGLLVIVDSPGGAVVPSESIHEAISRIRAKKPVVVSMQTIAASGGYMVACAANRIFAYDSTLTGSIGVIMQSANVTPLLEKLGITPQVIKSGAYKDAGSPFRPMTGQDRRYLQDIVMNLRNQFVAMVARSRNLPVDKVSALADGRVFTGRQARDLGLVDEIGDEPAATEWLKKRLKLPEDTEVREMEGSKTRLFKVFGEAREQLFANIFALASPRAYLF